MVKINKKEWDYLTYIGAKKFGNENWKKLNTLLDHYKECKNNNHPIHFNYGDWFKIFINLLKKET